MTNNKYNVGGKSQIWRDKTSQGYHEKSHGKCTGHNQIRRAVNPWANGTRGQLIQT